MHKHPAAGFGLSYVCTDREGWRVCVCACVLFFFFCGAANFLLMGKGFGGIQPIEKLIKL